ncbi:MAG TPA: GNAT family N-acyltransferase [Bdellovibrionota bacterium]|jgi:putative hemolysin
MKAGLTVRKLGRVSRLKARRPLRALRNFNAVRVLKKNKFPLHTFKPKIQVYQSTDKFILKTAESPFELRQVLKLRHEIFYKELQSRSHSTKLDFDEFDSICDHLIIIDRKTRKILGTYRLISSLYSERFYSQGEFNLTGVLELPGNKLELGRACIAQEFRTGTIINLLWKGIAEYISKTKSEYLFGCASVQTVDAVVASRLLALLRDKELVVEGLGVHPTEAYQCKLPRVAADESLQKEIPALIQSYILAGAKFYGEPALDVDFHCFDFFMMLKVSEMSRLFRRRYKLDESIG